MECEECEAEFAAPRSARRKYCSPGCYHEVQKRRRREQAGGWESGISWTGSGYKLILVGKGRPMANNNGYVPEHRLVMSQHIGRPLSSEEHVHHINGDRTDNRIENLQIVSRGEHTRLHQLGQPGRSTLTRWSRKHEACVKCGTTECSHNARGLCMNCYMVDRRAGFTQ